MIFLFLVAVRTQFKKFNLKYDTECFFPTTFEAILFIFRKDYPDNEIIVNDNGQGEESDPEDDTYHVVRYKAYKTDDQFFATTI